jgi:3-hydroxybutyryl-CoA dehydrogenase
MKIDDIKTIGVCGAGTMGSGIAQVCAQSGYFVILFDISDTTVQNGLKQIDKNLSTAVSKQKISEEEKAQVLHRIRITSTIQEVKAELIIEAILENKEVKQKLFNQLHEVNGASALFATNTSSIPISAISAEVPFPGRIAGMHFFNPPFLMKLVEVIRSEQTSEETAACIYDLCLRLGKYPVRAKDRPGFIVNRIGKMYHTEPIRIVEDGIADIRAVDELLEACGFRMGPFKLIDLIGVDANLNVTKSLYALMDYAPQFAPSELQQKLVDDGRLGKKTGKGFYDYPA